MVETIVKAFAYITENFGNLSALFLSLIAFLEVITRLTPTEKDDTAIQRVGNIVRKIFDAFGKVIPNRKKNGGEHIKQKEKEVK